MKRISTMALALLILLASVCATAQDAAPAGATYPGTWVEFEDGFQIYLPSEWIVVETDGEMQEAGFFFGVTSEDGAQAMYVSWHDVQITQAADLLAGVQAEYPDAIALESNDIAFVAFEDAAEGAFGVAALDGAGGMFTFMFYPLDDEAFVEQAVQIVSSISNVQ